MNTPYTAVLATLFAVGLLVSADAEARRLGGGKTLGIKRDAVTQRQATPPQQAAPAPQQTAPAAAPGAAAQVPAKPQGAMSRWLGPVAGLAAGLGLAALASHLGLGAEFASLLLIGLLVLAGFAVFRMLQRKPAPRPLRYAGAGGALDVPTGYETQSPPVLSQGGAGAQADRDAPTPVGGGTQAMFGAPGARAWPEGFDAETFLHHAKSNFVRLQAAHDRGDLDTLGEMLAPELLAEIRAEILARAGAAPPTEIVMLNAELIEVVTEGGLHWASVRFHGLTREDGAEQAQRFDEVWNLRKPTDDSTGWMLAGIQQLN